MKTAIHALLLMIRLNRYKRPEFGAMYTDGTKNSLTKYAFLKL